jgi:hypothetical protein
METINDASAASFSFISFESSNRTLTIAADHSRTSLGCPAADQICSNIVKITFKAIGSNPGDTGVSQDLRI